MNIDTEIKDEQLMRLASLYMEFNKENSDIVSGKILDLIEKKRNNEFVIGFAGHFSAGKSSMINELVGESILPSSPIPTSANVVKIKTGDPFVRIFYTNEPPVQFNGEMDIENIQSLSIDGDKVKALEVSKPILHLPTGVTIMDTPGIDSTNDADRIITEANLHLIDILFYVMDYNHVQSEVNLSFLKEMQGAGKDYYIIVNQVDKHSEHELTFRDYNQSVHDALKNWELVPKGVFYTSLKQLDHPNNELNQVKHCFNELLQMKDKQIENTAYHSAKTIIGEYVNQLEAEHEPQVEMLKEQIKKIENQLSNVNIEVNDTEKTDYEAAYKEGLQDILSNAYLMPYENRELAKQFLESQQPQFKAGLLFAKKKTEQMKEERLQQFYEKLLETAATQLETHVRNLFYQLSKQLNITDEHLLNTIQQFTVEYEKQQLVQLIKPGAEVTGNYVLVYTDEVVADIKKAMKKDSDELWHEMKKAYTTIHEKLEKEFTSYKEQQAKYDELQRTLQNIYDYINEKEKELVQLIDGTSSNDIDMEFIFEQLQDRHLSLKIVDDLAIRVEPSVEKEEKQYSVNDNEKHPDFSVQETIEILENSKNLIQKFKGFKSISNDLQNKKERLENRHFTVALFGAFSAGKSSFANALLGEAVLPVSPNPTTATINKISPSNEEHSHGTVKIRFKSEKQLLEDVTFLLGELPYTSFDKLIHHIEKQDLSKLKLKAKNISFLQALISGFSETKDYIGNELLLTIEEAKRYIAEEKYACFVEWVETFYDSSLTEQGITLVDTPGADSVNARHTDVAFQYIKDADAILFVTYYNHAFSRADREFLIQLGRVKDVFSIDKMFFIINAADLAKDDEELQLVQSYVENELLQFGIRNPRMFAISSKLGLEEKKNNNLTTKSGLPYFEEQFNEFIETELTNIFIQSALYDVKRIAKMLRSYIDSAEMSKEKKEKLRQKYETDRENIIQFISDMDTGRFKKTIEHELQELFYYIHQRIFLRFSDLFKESFNPSTIKSNGKKGLVELQLALQELLQYLKQNLIHEIQATGLRIDTFMQSQIIEWVKEMERKEELREYQITFSDQYELSFQYPSVNVQIEDSSKELERVFRIFKNTKSFFEQNGKDQMKEALEERLKPIIKEVLEEKEIQLIDFFLPQWEDKQSNVKDIVIAEVKEYFEGLLFNLSDQVNINELKQVYGYIQKQVQLS